jgi:predicted TIM-barrel fold metal-dependent hydrolase
MWDDVRRYLLPANRNVYFDTAYVSFYLNSQDMTKTIRDIGPDRVVFGSDYPWEEPGRAAKIIMDLGLSDEEKDALLWQNAIKLIG